MQLCLSVTALDRVEKLDVLLVIESRLRVIQRLPLESTILNVENAVRVALDVGIVRHHDAGGVLCLIDIKQEIHNLDGVLCVQVTGRLVK